MKETKVCVILLIYDYNNYDIMIMMIVMMVIMLKL
jgi:hypothetical protein